MTTESLRKDHDLIEKVLNAMKSSLVLLKDGKSIPAPILENVLDFSTNFTNVCHHGKEENSLFPALEQTGMPRNFGPIGRMLKDHEMTKVMVDELNESSKQYIKTGDSSKLIIDIEKYVIHVNEHLNRENNRLFMMAEMRLKEKSNEIENSLNKVEEDKLNELGKTRKNYEDLAEEIVNKISEQ